MAIPKMSGALWGLTQENQFALLRKTIVDHQLVETNDVVARFQGTLQAVKEKDVIPLREGERDWKFWNMLTKEKLPGDSIVADRSGRQYRVMSVGDWSQSGYFVYLLAEQPPQSTPPAAYATGTREPIVVLADILQTNLGLSDAAVVLAYEKNLIPKTSGLYVSLDYVGPSKCISNSAYIDPVTSAEVQTASFSHLIQMDLLSYDSSARRRKEEAAMALISFYAIQQMDTYGISIARNPSPFVDASSLEPTKRLNRFISSVQIFALHRKVLAPPAILQGFTGQITEGGPLVPFSAAAPLT